MCPKAAITCTLCRKAKLHAHCGFHSSQSRWQFRRINSRRINASFQRGFQRRVQSRCVNHRIDLSCVKVCRIQSCCRVGRSGGDCRRRIGCRCSRCGRRIGCRRSRCRCCIGGRSGRSRSRFICSSRSRRSRIIRRFLGRRSRFFCCLGSCFFRSFGLSRSRLSSFLRRLHAELVIASTCQSDQHDADKDVLVHDHSPNTEYPSVGPAYDRIDGKRKDLRTTPPTPRANQAQLMRLFRLKLGRHKTILRQLEPFKGPPP